MQDLKSKEVDAKVIGDVEPCVLLHPQNDFCDLQRDNITAIINKFGTDISVAVARGTLAPYIFFSRSKSGFFYIGTTGKTIFSWSYVGPENAYEDAVHDLREYAQNNNLLLSLLESEERILRLINNSFKCSSFGYLQLVESLKSLNLSGQPMRRLRYLVKKYSEHGDIEISEYSGSNDKDKEELLELIDCWVSEKKAKVGDYIFKFRNVIETNSRLGKRRLFITKRDGYAECIIVISRLESKNGYLMDLEFYKKGELLGALEYSIWNIMQILASEGNNYFSLGLTFGVGFEETEYCDKRLVARMKGLHSAKILNNDGNFQFKNKFRTSNIKVYLCSPDESGSKTLPDILGLFGSVNEVDAAYYSETLV